MKKGIILLFCILNIIYISAFELPDIEPIKLEPFATFSDSIINESSGIAKSRNIDNLYWTLNDSGDKARIFPVDKNGNVYKPEWYDTFDGLEIANASNIDWEDIAVDNDGNIIIGACGNNGNVRKDLAIYIVKEPHPLGTIKTRYDKMIPFHFPDQKEFPPKMVNFDCEAVFSDGDDIYVLSKHRSDTNTCLYKFVTMNQLEDNTLEKITEFPIHGNVTGADCSIDGTKLAVITYNNIWLFESTEKGNWFNGKKLWMPISAKQCEAICFDGDQLIITNEQMEIFEVPMDKFIEIGE